MAAVIGTGLLQPLWDYLAVSVTPYPADVVFVFGSADLAVPDRAARLYHEGFASRVLVSGSFGRRTRNVFPEPEAYVFRERLVARGVPGEAIVAEPAAASTLENVRFGMAALADHGLRPRSALLVAKGFALRRCVATFARQHPEVRVHPCRPEASLETAFDRSPPEFAARLVAELERLERYAAQGDIEPQEVPPGVRAAARQITAALGEQGS